MSETKEKSFVLFHIVNKADWEKHSDGRSYKPESLAKNGFIHLSTKEQVLSTANAFFKGQHNLLLLELEITATDSRLKWEKVSGRDDLFPHYYSSLPIVNVKKIYTFEPKADGTFEFPENQTKIN